MLRGFCWTHNLKRFTNQLINNYQQVCVVQILLSYLSVFNMGFIYTVNVFLYLFHITVLYDLGMVCEVFTFLFLCSNGCINKN